MRKPSIWTAFILGMLRTHHLQSRWRLKSYPVSFSACGATIHKIQTNTQTDEKSLSHRAQRPVFFRRNQGIERKQFCFRPEGKDSIWDSFSLRDTRKLEPLVSNLVGVSLGAMRQHAPLHGPSHQ